MERLAAYAGPTWTSLKTSLLDYQFATLITVSQELLKAHDFAHLNQLKFHSYIFSLAVNQITFGNRGELYINIGSNTNGGVPGRLSGSGIMKENYFSAATNVANLAHPMFDGFIEYDALDDGSPVNATGVSVFAPGLRNPFGITLHSNGNLYGTDNGPNTGYGKYQLSVHINCRLEQHYQAYRCLCLLFLVYR